MNKIGNEPSLEQLPGDAIENANEKPKKPWKKRLPAWISDHSSNENIKMLFRCSVSAWVTLILVFITPSLHLLGSAAFFGAIVQFFFPPSGVVFLQLLAIVTMALGIGLAWGWGVITMKAALAARPSAETQAALLALENQAVESARASNSSISSAAQNLVFDGALLDVRVTSVFFVLGLVFIYLIARLQQKYPATLLMSFFAFVITDIFLTTGPLLPAFNGTLPTVLILPSALSIAISLCSTLFIFPRSTSHMTLLDIQLLLCSLKPILDTFQSGIEKHPELPELATLRANKAKLFRIFNDLMMKFSFLPLDISVGRWSADDIVTLRPFLRRLVVTGDALNNLYITRSEVVMKHRKQQGHHKASSENSAVWKSSSIARHQSHAMYDFIEHLQHEDSQKLMAKTIAILEAPTLVLLDACRLALDNIYDAVAAVDKQRWYRRPSREWCVELAARHESTLEHLRSSKREFSASIHEELIAPYTYLFDANGQMTLRGKNTAAMHSLVLSINLSEGISRIASATEAVLFNIIVLEKKRMKTQVWLPKKLRRPLAWLFNLSSLPSPSIGDEKPIVIDTDCNSSENDLDENGNTNDLRRQETKIKKAEISEKPKQLRKQNKSAFVHAIISINQWFANEHGIFALRMTIVSFALAIPAVIPSSAGFYYREKGLWALIMGQTGLTIYMADLVFAVVGRVTFCVLGGILGMLAWYIGSGNGPGNPYGLAAICAPFIVFLMFFRLHAPKSLIPLSVIGAATFILVVGYGYIDTHLDIYGNPGYGYTVFWRRVLLVMIGFAGAIIVQCFPAAPSATQHVSDSLSTSLDSISRLYIHIVNSWLAVPDGAEATDTFSFHVYHSGKDEQGLRFAAHKTALHILRSLSMLELNIKSVAYEATASPFTRGKLTEIHILMNQIVETESLLLGQFEALNPEFRCRFKMFTAALNEALVADIIAVLSMVSSSLKTGAPLPALMPTPLLARSYGLATWKGMNTLQLNILRDTCWPAYSLLTTGYITLLSRIDDLVVVVKEAVGESHIIEGEIESGGWGFGHLSSPNFNITDKGLG